MSKPAIGHGYVPAAVLTIAEFCEAHRISRTTLHNLDKAGSGPRKMRIGRRVMITAEAAADWRRQLEESSAEVA